MLDGFTLLIIIFLFLFTNFGKPRQVKADSDNESNLSGSIESDKEDLTANTPKEQL